MRLFFVLFLFTTATMAQRGLDIEPTSPTGEVIGKQYLLTIGINKYKKWPQLKTAVNDAKGIKKILHQKYYFNPKHTVELYDAQATEKNILRSLRKLIPKMKPEDSFFIFYAGHGHFDKMTNTSSWIPVESDTEETDTWIDTDRIKKLITRCKSRHVLLISDSCFSGDFFRGKEKKISLITDKLIKRSYGRISRQVITSGGLEPVSDSGFTGHSVFTHFLIKAFERNKKPYLIPSEIYSSIRRGVVENAKQTPEFGSLRGTGGEQGGEYVFFLEGANSKKTVKANNWRIESDADLTRKYFNHGKAHQKLGNYKKAIIEYTKAIDLKPDYIKAYYSRGFSYHMLGQYKQAIVEYSKVLKLAPNHSNTYYAQGLTYKTIKEQEKAIENFTKAIELQPDFAEPYYHRAMLYDQQKKHKKAIYDFKKFLQYSGKNHKHIDQVKKHIKKYTVKKRSIFFEMPVKAYKIINIDTGKAIFFKDKFFPGTVLNLAIKFKKYATVHKKIEIVSGSGPLVVRISMRRLKQYDFTIRKDKYKFDGIVYPYVFYADDKHIEDHLVGKEKGIGRFYYTLYVNPQVKNLKAFAGYLYAQRPFSRLRRGLSRLSYIDIPRLIKHLNHIALNRGYYASLEVMDNMLKKYSHLEKLKRNSTFNLSQLVEFMQGWKFVSAKDGSLQQTIVNKLNILKNYNPKKATLTLRKIERLS